MQARHKEPDLYFEEMATSCRNYYIPYITGKSDIKLGVDCNVLEIGCGFGGILSVFAEMECKVTGVDIQKRAVDLALGFFADKGLEGTFVCSDIFDYNDAEQPYDLIILHDSLEHIAEKERLMIRLRNDRAFSEHPRNPRNHRGIRASRKQNSIRHRQSPVIFYQSELSGQIRIETPKIISAYCKTSVCT